MQQYPPQYPPQQPYPPQQQYPPQGGVYGEPSPAPYQPYAAAPTAQPGMPMAMPMQQIPPGAPPGGTWVNEKYCGTISWIIGICIFPCIACCPIDDRQVYVSPDGRRFSPFGALA